MFDGTPPASPDSVPEPARPHPFDVRAMLPMVRVQPSAVGVDYLAKMTAHNMLTALRWVAVHHGPDADVLAVAAADFESPAGKAVDALMLLHDACDRHRLVTGADGVALARQAIARDFGQDFAAFVMAPIMRASAAREELDDVLDRLLLRAEAPPAEPTAEDRRRGLREALSLAMADPRLTGLQAALDALQAAVVYDGRQLGEATRTAMEVVTGMLQDAADRGVARDDLQMVLKLWAEPKRRP